MKDETKLYLSAIAIVLEIIVLFTIGILLKIFK